MNGFVGRAAFPSSSVLASASTCRSVVVRLCGPDVAVEEAPIEVDEASSAGDADGEADDPSSSAPAEDQNAWLVELRRSMYTGNTRRVARIILAMGSTEYADLMHAAIAQEIFAYGNFNRYVLVLHALKDYDMPPHHAAELWDLVSLKFCSATRPLHQWNAVIASLVRAGDVTTAKELVLALERDPTQPLPDIKTYTILMEGVMEVDGPRQAIALYQRTMVKALEPDSICCLIMLVAHVRAFPPDLEAAKRWLRKGELRMTLEKRTARDIQSLYNTLIFGYAKMARVQDCFTLLGCMRARGVKPDQYTFHILMRSCLKHSPYGVQECRQLLRLMEQTNVEPSTANYNVLIRGYANTGQLTSALRVANRMREAGVRWDNCTYFHLIRGVVAAGQVELSLRLLAKMRKDNVRPKVEHYTVAFVGLAQAGYYTDAARVFRRLCSLKGIADRKAYNLMIGIHSMRGDIEAAVEVSNAMRHAGFDWDTMTYCFLIRGHIIAKQWADALELEEPFVAFRDQVEGVLRDADATTAELTAARKELEMVSDWSKTYHLLVDACIWDDDAARAVRILEDCVRRGLPIIPGRHAQLLRHSPQEIRLKAGIDGTYRYYSAREPEQAERQEAQDTWMRSSPNLGYEAGSLVAINPARVDAAELAEGVELVEPVTIIPPHIFCASFSPIWLGGDQTDCSPDELLDRFFEGQAGSSDFYRAVHDHYHATVHRRDLATVRLAPGQFTIGRTAAETIESLHGLFDTFGRPGESGAPVYLFMRPEAANFDALLAMLAAGAAHPESVFILRPAEPRPEEGEGEGDDDRRRDEEVNDTSSATSFGESTRRSTVAASRTIDPVAVKRLAGECQERGERSLAFALMSTLKYASAAALLNDRALVVNDWQVFDGAPSTFEETLRRALGDVAQGYEGGRFRQSGNSSRAWRSWLDSHGMRQLIRCEGEKIRLDCTMHKPALSKAEFFRVRGIPSGDLAVDLWIEDEGSVTEFSGEVRAKRRRRSPPARTSSM